MTKPISKTRRLINSLKYGDENRETSVDLGLISYTAFELLRRDSPINASLVKITFLRRLVLIADKITL